MRSTALGAALLVALAGPAWGLNDARSGAVKVECFMVDRGWWAIPRIVWDRRHAEYFASMSWCIDTLGSFRQTPQHHFLCRKRGANPNTAERN